MAGNDRLKKTTLLALAVMTIFIFSAEESFAQNSRYPCWEMGPWMMGGAMGWIGGIFMMFFWVLVLIALVLFIRWLVSAGGSRFLPGSQLPQGPVESALDILKKRYARGEITREQFDSMRRDVE